MSANLFPRRSKRYHEILHTNKLSLSYESAIIDYMIRNVF